LQDHYERVNSFNQRVEPSVDLLPEPSGASHEGEDVEDRWWDMPPCRPSLVALQDKNKKSNT
jgi:hypothetical protein